MLKNIKDIAELRRCNCEYFDNEGINPTVYILYTDVDVYRAHGDTIILASDSDKIILASRKHKAVLSINISFFSKFIAKIKLEEYNLGKDGNAYAIKGLIDEVGCFFIACVDTKFSRFRLYDSTSFDLKYTKLRLGETRFDRILNWLKLNSLKMFIAMAFIELLAAVTQLIVILVGIFNR